MRNPLLLILALAGSAARAGAQRDTTHVISLGDAARIAAQQSAPALTAQYRAEAAHSRALEARSGLMPQISGSYGDGRRTYNTASFGLPFPGFDPNGQIIGPVRTVDFRGHFVASLIDPTGIARYRAASAAASGANAEAVSVTNQAAAIATVAYVRALRADAQVSASAADSSLAADLLGIANRQLTAGVGVALDVTRARAQLAGTRASLIAARNERDRARLDLLRALGFTPTDSLVLSDSLGATAVEAPSETNAVASALRGRADLRAAVAATLTAHRALGAARSEFLPSVGVFGDDGATSNTYTHLLNTYTYGFQLSVPIFTGFRTSAHVQEQSAAVKEADVRLHDLERQVITDVRAALLDLNAGQEQVSAGRERLMLGEQELAQARERFRAGVAGNADVITAQLLLNGARSQYIDALASLELARVSLARAEGRLLELP